MGAEIQPNGIRTGLRERQCKIAGATAQIQRAIFRLHGGQFHDASFPKPVQAEALEVVDQIITPGDGGEEVIDLRGALFARVVKNIAHADSLAQWPEEKSKPQKLCFASAVVFCYDPVISEPRKVNLGLI